MNKKHILAWFLFGLGSQLQIIASLSFTELFVFIAAPFLFFSESVHMKRNCVMLFFLLSLLVVVGCVVACIVNETHPLFVLRGMAVTCLLPCTIIVGHWMLRRDMGGFKWMLVGAAISSVLCTFVFQKSVEVTMLAGGDRGDGAIEAIISGPLFWIDRLGAILGTIPKGWYLQCPPIVSMGIPLFMAGFAMLTSTSGRSAALGAIGAAALIFVGGKKRETIRRRLCNKFGFWFGCAILGVFCLHALYRISATQGWLGEEALNKYEQQTQGDASIKKLLLGGRMESFCGFLACFDKPIVGFGPWAMDSNGYVDEFLARYGTGDDYASYIKAQERNMKKGNGFKMIPCHAYITEFWLWYGIFGLIFWGYVIFVLIRYLKQDCWVVPQWFMWIAAGAPRYFWDIFFSPWSNRIGGMVFVVACLMARAVRQGRHKMPEYMVEEIVKVESK
jgi:hypothetical protein